jgi:prepilin-type processing-associated H-X9-DG protein
MMANMYGHGPAPTANYLGIYSGLSDGDTCNEAFNPSAFNAGQRGVFRFNVGTTIAEITDGTSNTMVVSEYLTGIAGQPGSGTAPVRGWIYTHRAGQHFLQVTNTPNSSAPDNFWNNVDGCGSPSDSAPQLNLPCVVGSDTDNFASPRSRHAGGVNILLGDGAVRFVQDSIDLQTWRNLGWMADGNVLADY